MKTQSTAAAHPSSVELEGFALGALDATRAAIVEGHLYRCDRCADLVAKVPGDEFLEQLRAAARPVDSAGNIPASDRRSNLSSTFGWLRSPIVWLPVLTLLVSIMWLLFR